MEKRTILMVLNNDDIVNYLSSQEQYDALSDICRTIEKGRIADGKKLETYMVINMDESYAPEVIEILKKNGDWGG